MSTIHLPPKVITSPSNPIVKDIKALEQRKYRKETGLFLVEGLRSVIEGMELGAELKYLAFHADKKDQDEIKRCVAYCYKCKGLPLEVNDLVLEKISRKDNPQAVIGVFTQNIKSIEDIDLEYINNKNGTYRNYVVLEQVRDPGNLGTIMRTIDAIGAAGVILVDQCCDPYSVETVRATMGSIFSVPVYTTSRDKFIDWSKNWPGDLIGTTLQTSIDFRERAPRQPLLLLMGNEQAGLTNELREAATYCIRLPMNGRADSLNLAVATGVSLYALIEPWGKNT